MRKLFLFIIISFFILSCFLFENDSMSLSNFFTTGNYSIFSRDKKIVSSFDWEGSIGVGNEFILSTNIFNAKTLKIDKNKIRGEMAQLDNQELKNLKKMKKTIDYKFHFKETVADGIIVEYGFSPKLAKFLIIDGEKINIQIAYRTNSFIVGHPLILGAF